MLWQATNCISKIFKMEVFVMGYHIYMKTWKPIAGEKLDTAMEPNNIMDKFAVASNYIVN